MDRPYKRSIGAVTFAAPCPKTTDLAEIRAGKGNACGWKHAAPMGAERIRLLKLARAGEPLPDGLFLIGQHRGGGGYGPITRDEVDWETSGLDKR